METCKEAVERWNSGLPIMSINISGMSSYYEEGCQRIMFSAIEQHLGRAGDKPYWDSLVGSDAASFFSDAKTMCEAEGMTGAMWSYSIRAAVVMLRNEWAGGIELAPKDRLIEVQASSTASSNTSSSSTTV
jgi:hypothetical protein